MEEGERLRGASWNALTALPALGGPATPLLQATPASPVPRPHPIVRGLGEGGLRASQLLGKRPRQGQVRPLAPRRGPNALSLRDQGGGAPEAGEKEEGGSAEQ